MLRVFAIAAMFALAVPTLATAQAPPPPGKRVGPPPGRPPGPPPARAFVGPAHPVVVPHGPPGPAGAQFSYRGRMINRLHITPFVYPAGYAYRRWVIGAILPPLFLVPDYYYADWATLGLAEPPPGFQWLRYGPDLLLVNTATGQVVDTVYGVFY